MKTLNESIKSILSLIVVIMTYGIFILILVKYRTDSNAVSQVLIATAGGFGVATGYYFGSSQSASKKDETIASLSANAPVSPPVTTNTGDININPVTDTKPLNQ